MLGSVFAVSGFLFLLRFLFFYLSGDGDGHIQSVVFGATMLMIGVQIISLAFIADLLSVNRKLSEEIKSRISEK